jgi:hypothetical protein
MTYERWRYLAIVLVALIAGFYLVGLAYHTALSFAGAIFTRPCPLPAPSSSISPPG